MEEYLDSQFAKHIENLIDVNRSIKCLVDAAHGSVEIERPNFIRSARNRAAGNAGDSVNMTNSEISQLIKGLLTATISFPRLRDNFCI